MHKNQDGRECVFLQHMISDLFVVVTNVYVVQIMSLMATHQYD